MACCSSEHYTPLKILESYFQEAAEAAKESMFVEVSDRDEVKVIIIHPRDHATLRDLLSRLAQSSAGKLRVKICSLSHVVTFVIQLLKAKNMKSTNYCCTS